MIVGVRGLEELARELNAAGLQASGASALRVYLPLGSRPLGSRPLGSRPLGSRPLGSRPLGSRSLGSRPLAWALLVMAGRLFARARRLLRTRSNTHG